MQHDVARMLGSWPRPTHTPWQARSAGVREFWPVTSAGGPHPTTGRIGQSLRAVLKNCHFYELICPSVDLDGNGEVASSDGARRTFPTPSFICGAYDLNSVMQYAFPACHYNCWRRFTRLF